MFSDVSELYLSVSSIFLFHWREKCEFLKISIMPVCRTSVRLGKKRKKKEKKNNVAIFLDTENVIKVKPFMLFLLIELYPLIPLSVTLNIFQGHSSVKHF